MFQPKWRMLRDFITLANIVDSPKWIFDQTRGYKKFQKKAINTGLDPTVVSDVERNR